MDGGYEFVPSLVRLFHSGLRVFSPAIRYGIPARKIRPLEVKELMPTFRAPQALGKAINEAKTKEELKPLLQVYYQIYGRVPETLYHMYDSLPSKPK